MSPAPGRLSPYPLTVGQAPAKVILAGEHAVVYGHAAVAVPVRSLTARASIALAPPGYGTVIVAEDLGRASRLEDGDPALQALVHAVRTTLDQAGAQTAPDWIIQVRSEIPIGRGMGSGAAVACALVQAVARGQQWHPDASQISDIVFGSEQYLHGTPSGIDNAVIAHAQPLLFRQGQPPYFFAPQLDMPLLMADTGIAAPTSEVVKAVARRRQADPSGIEKIMAEIGTISLEVCAALCDGDADKLAFSMNRNQDLLRDLGVSSPVIERLIQAAMATGAQAAKLTGAGMGGQVLVFAGNTDSQRLQQSLLVAGARAVFPLALRCA